MAASPRWKVYLDGEYVASCHYPIHAAMIVGAHGSGEVCYGHRAKERVWVEGEESHSAADSWDSAAAVMVNRAYIQLGKA